MNVLWSVDSESSSKWCWLWWEDHLNHSASKHKTLTVIYYKNQKCVFTATANMEIKWPLGRPGGVEKVEKFSGFWTVLLPACFLFLF